MQKGSQYCWLVECRIQQPALQSFLKTSFQFRSAKKFSLQGLAWSIASAKGLKKLNKLCKMETQMS